MADNPVSPSATTASAQAVAPGATISFETDFVINENLAESSFGYLIYNIASNATIGGYDKSFPPSALTTGSTIHISFPLVVPAGTALGLYGVQVHAHVNSGWTTLVEQRQAATFNVDTAGPLPVTIGPTSVSAASVVRGGTITVATNFAIQQNLPDTSFNYQIFSVTSDVPIGSYNDPRPASALHAGSTVSASHMFTIPATADLDSYRVEVTVNTTSTWDLIAKQYNAVTFQVQEGPTAAVTLLSATASATSVAPNATVTFTANFRINQNLAQSSFGFQVFEVATNVPIGGLQQSFDPNALTAGSTVSVSYPLTIPAGAAAGAYRVELSAHTNSSWAVLFEQPSALTFQVQTSGVSIFPKATGAFVYWGESGRETTLKAWETWLNQVPSSVIAKDFYNCSAWADYYSTFDWLPNLWKTMNPARKLCWSVSLTVPGTPLADVAAGLHDAEFTHAARTIAAAQPDAIIRIGWEMNISSMAWFAVGHYPEYIAAYRRVVGLFRAQSAGFKFDWCPGAGSQEGPADLAYPGDDVVDYIGLDVYDYTGGTSVEDRWATITLNGPFGLSWHRTFAAAHGKLISYPEWGVGEAGDNPYFVQQMYDWFTTNSAQLAYACYFNVNGLWPTQIDNNQFPLSQALFQTLFRRP